MRTEEIIRGAAVGIEVTGIAAMVVGILVAGALAIRTLARRGAGAGYRELRERIGRAILLGLELLVAADIIRTVAEVPSLEKVAVLAGIVVIRTFLSFTLEIELTGHVPWRSPEHRTDASPCRAISS